MDGRITKHDTAHEAAAADVDAVSPGVDLSVLPLLLGRRARLPGGGGRRRWLPRGRAGLVIALLFIAVLLGWAIAPSVFGGTDPTGINPLAALAGPSARYPFGTDQYGRSIYDELVYGARPALEVGVLATLIGGGAGSLIGIVGGYLGGWTDLLVMRLIDILLALPGLLLALIFVAALPRTLSNEIIAISVSTVPIFARVLRAQALQVRSRLFVDAAAVSGIRRRTVVTRHVIPNCLAPAMALAAVYVGVAIVIAASLSFLGLGPSEVVPDWGELIQSGQGYIDHDWWISVFPGVVVTLVVIAVSVIGDRVQAALEPAHG
jgi:peptide/nickel transport system permease protein